MLQPYIIFRLWDTVFLPEQRTQQSSSLLTTLRLRLYFYIYKLYFFPPCLCTYIHMYMFFCTFLSWRSIIFCIPLNKIKIRKEVLSCSLFYFNLPYFYTTIHYFYFIHLYFCYHFLLFVIMFLKFLYTFCLIYLVIYKIYAIKQIR